MSSKEILSFVTVSIIFLILVILISNSNKEVTVWLVVMGCFTSCFLVCLVMNYNCNCQQENLDIYTDRKNTETMSSINYENSNVNRRQSFQLRPKQAEKRQRLRITTLSASSWCGYSQKQKALHNKIKNQLNKIGIDYIFVDDLENKGLFEELSTIVKPEGFPFHNIVDTLTGNTQRAAGFLSPEELISKVKENFAPSTKPRQQQQKQQQPETYKDHSMSVGCYESGGNGYAVSESGYSGGMERYNNSTPTSLMGVPSNSCNLKRNSRSAPLGFGVG